VAPSWQSWLVPADYDVIVLEEGGPHSFQAGMFRPGSLIIDAGFHWQDGRQCGNVEIPGFEDDDKPWLLPVPGGLGPLLITMLLSNLIDAVRFNA
jgi:methylenetetrahydrofolate dehydrogenase (NADP+)/methenyltetrahydrofolate cyclohydrolase